MSAAAERVGTFEHDSEAWHAARASGIGASEIAAVVGLSPYESHFSLWHRKAGLIGPQPVNELMTWGHYLEPAIAQRFADENPGLRVQRTGTWRSKARPWQIANPDRLAYWCGHRAPVEIKWSPHADGWGATGTDEVPVYYRCQIMWQMDVLGAEHAYIAALVSSDYRKYVIPRDPDDVAVLRKAGQEFMDSLAAGKAPDIDATGHTYQVLRELHPDIEDREVEVSDIRARLWRGARANLADAHTWEQQVRNELLAQMGSAKYAVHDGERIARRQPGRGGAVSLHEVKPPKTPKTIKEATQ